MNEQQKCDHCRTPYPRSARFCSFCGKALHAVTVVDQSRNRGGTNVHAGRDVLMGDHERWDQRPKAEMGRETKRRLWPIDLVSCIAAVMTIASFLGASALPALVLPLGALGLLTMFGMLLALRAREDLRSHAHHVLPGRWGTLERAEDASTWFTRPVAACPWCPDDHRRGTMTVRRTEHGPHWSCPNSSLHDTPFDVTQLPPLAAA